MSTWLVARQELTAEQMRTVELPPYEHQLILGASGAGKTQILLHRARYLCDTFHVAEGHFQIFVFTNLLKEYIRSALPLLRLPLDCVTTLDDWCTAFYQGHIGRRLPQNRVTKGPDFAAIRRTVLNKLRKPVMLDGVMAGLRGNPSKQPLFEFVLVDEGQELDEEAFELLETISKHVTVCMDDRQHIDERGSHERQPLAQLRLKWHVALLEVSRCCPYIFQLAAHLVKEPEAAKESLPQTHTVHIEKETPLLYRAADCEDEKRRLIEMLRIRLARGDTIAILLSQTRYVYEVAQELREAGQEIETPEDCDFSTDLPKILPFNCAKGLTFDTVLLPRLVSSAFTQWSESQIDRLLFVGMTRAIKWIYMSTTGNCPFPSLEKLEAATLEGCLTVQCARQGSRGLREQDEEEPPPYKAPASVDSAKYAQLKPIFMQILQRAQADGLDYDGFIRVVASHFGEPILPYLLHFHSDLQRPPVP